jgi:outer membrane protein
MRKKSALASSNVQLVSLTVRTAIISGTLFMGTAHAADLREVYEQAKNYDATYRTAQFNLDGASRRVPLAKSAFRPQLTLGADAGIGTASDDGIGGYEDTALTLTLSQSLYNRSDKKLIDQAKLGALQADAQYAAVGQTLILRVATAYFDVLRAKASQQFSQSELQAISRQKEQAERRFDVGLVPITDVRSAQAQYDLAIAQEIAASNSLSTAREALLRISGLSTNSLAGLANDLPLTPPEPADIDQWVKIAKEQNLELVIARLAAESSKTQIAIERANKGPTLSLVGTAAATTTGQVGRSDAKRGELKLQLRLPILTGGRVNALVAQARAQSQSSAENLIAQERATTQQTRDGYRGVQASISRVKALRQALVSTQKSAEATEAGFRAGTRTSVEVLQALRDTYRARSDYAGAKYDYIINSLNLKAASGTLTEEDIFSINRFLVTSTD